MPKMKTHKGASKRFKKTKSGKIKRARAFGGHLLEKKSAKRKRRLRQATFLSKADHKRISKLIS